MSSIPSQDILYNALKEEVVEQGLIFLDADGLLFDISESALELLRLDRRKVIGTSFFSAIPLATSNAGALLPQEVHPVQKAITNHVSQVQPFFCFFHIEGEESVPLVLKASVVKDKKRIEMLAVIVRVRKAQRQFNIRDMQTSFVSLAAHQLKTPAGIAQGYLELALKELPNHEDLKNLKSFMFSAYEAVHTVTRSAKDLLNATKINGGLLQPTISEIRLDDIIFSRQLAYEKWIQSKHITVSVHSSHRPFLVNSDKHVISELFDIFFHNALKYTPQDGSIIVTLSKPTHSTRFELHIEDSGPGFGAEMEEATNPETEIFTNGSHGMGVRLATQYVALLKGELGFEKAVPHGTKIMITLPDWK